MLTMQRSYHPNYHNLIFFRYYTFSSSFCLIYHYVHIDKVKYGVTCSGYLHKHLKLLYMFLFCFSQGIYINNKSI